MKGKAVLSVFSIAATLICHGSALAQDCNMGDATKAEPAQAIRTADAYVGNQVRMGDQMPSSHDRPQPAGAGNPRSQAKPADAIRTDSDPSGASVDHWQPPFGE